MYKIYSLGSSSSGNCFVIYDGVSYLVLDAGIKRNLTKKLFEHNIDLNKIDGVLITHAHQDHMKALNNWCNQDRYMTFKTLNIWKQTNKIKYINNIKRFSPNSSFKIGKWEINAISNKFHDIGGAVYYAIKNASDEVITYITDTSKIVGNIPNAEAYIIEANHFASDIEREIEETDDENKLLVLRRALKTHLSAETCVEYLNKNIGDKTELVVLMHMSATRSNQSRISSYVKDNIKKNVRVEYIDPKEEDGNNSFTCGYIPRVLKA